MGKKFFNGVYGHAVAVVVLSGLGISGPMPLFAGTAVLGGSAVLEQTRRATLTVNGRDAAAFSSSSPSAVLDWSKFDIGGGQSMTFDGRGTTFFNLVSASAGKSQIDGMIGGSGSVWVINPSGIAFGAGAQVNVGGLFAAAAGNISNAEALRNGVGMTPEFSSFGGSVEVAGSSFTADQVALMGKTVSAAGDFSGVANLAVGAAGKLTVDNVEGGRVTVSLGDFAEPEEDAGAVLGDLLLGGGLSVRSSGSVRIGNKSPASGAPRLLATETGSIVQADDIDIMTFDDLVVNGKVQSAEGSVSLTSYGGMDVSADVSANGNVSLNAWDGVSVNADVTSENGSVSVFSYFGGIEVGADAMVSAAKDVNLVSAMYGDKGDISVKGNVVAGESSYIYSGYGVGYGAYGDISVEGNVSVGGSAQIWAFDGNVNIKNGASVESTGAYGEVDVYTGVGEGTGGDIQIGGNVAADNVYGQVLIVAGKEEGGSCGSGSVTLESTGRVTADYYAELAAGDGDVTVNGGTVTGGATVALDTRSGDITVAEGSRISTTGESYGAYFDELFGFDKMPTSVSLLAAMASGGEGNVTVNGSVAAGEGGQVLVATGRSVDGTMSGGSGDISIGGDISADRYVQINTRDGNATVAAGGAVGVGGDDGEISVMTAMGDSTTKGDITIDGDVSASGTEGKIVVMAGTANNGSGSFTLGSGGSLAAEAGRVDVDAEGAVNVVGKVGAKDEVTLIAHGGGMTLGADSEVSAGASVKLSAQGSISGNGALSATPPAASVVIQSEGEIALGGKVDASILSLTANGDVSADNAQNNIGLVTGEGKSFLVRNRLDLMVGNIHATDGDIDVQSDVGKVSVNGNLKSTGGDVALSGGNGVNGIGTVEAPSGTLSVNGGSGNINLSDIVVEAGEAKMETDGYVNFGDMTVSGDLTVEAGSFIGQKENTAITAGGKTVLASGRGVTLFNDGNDFGVLVASGGDVYVSDSNGIELGNVSATSGGVHVKTATGDIKVGGDATVAATAEGGTVFLDAAVEEGSRGDVVVAGGVHADSAVQLSAASGKGSSGGVKVSAGATVSANGLSSSAKLVAASGENSSGSVTMEGSLLSRGEDGAATIAAGTGAGASGKVQVSGKMSATGYAEIRATNGKITTGAKSVVEATGDGASVRIATVDPKGSSGNISINGVVRANGDGGRVTVASETEDAGRGLLSSGRGDIVINGQIQAKDSILLSAGFSEGSSGDVTVKGSVTAGSYLAVVSGDGDVTVNGAVRTTGADGQLFLATGVNKGSAGDIAVNGNVRSEGNGGDVYLMTGVRGDTTGGISFGLSGKVVANDGAYVSTHGGNVTQAGASVAPAGGGYIEESSLSAAISASTVNLNVDGSVGNGTYGYLAVNGKVFGSVSGDASIAAANGGSFMGGENPGRVSTAYGIMDWGNMNANSTIQVSGDLSVYTAGKVEANGLLVSGGDMTVSAKSFGDMSYLQAGGTLKINNVGRASSPVLAYFESVDGGTSRINNQANNTVVFIDGRLAGGNIQTLNKLGATEAFPVQTPELKSEQGVFGNPVFVHGGLDVSEPVGIGVIDFLLVDRAKMSYGSDIPDDMDMEVSINGLSPLYSYWFGLMAAAR